MQAFREWVTGLQNPSFLPELGISFDGIHLNRLFERIDHILVGNDRVNATSWA